MRRRVETGLLLGTTRQAQSGERFTEKPIGPSCQLTLAWNRRQ